MSRLLRSLALFATLAIVVSACAPDEFLELLGLGGGEQTEEAAEDSEEGGGETEDGGETARQDAETATETGAEEESLGTGIDNGASSLPSDLAGLGSATLTPGRYSLQTEGAFVTLPEAFEVGTSSPDGVHRDDPSQVIGVLQRPPMLASEPAQFEATLDSLRDLGPGVEVVLDTAVEIAGADQAQLVLAEDGSEAVAYLLARAPLGAALIGYSAPVEVFDPEVVAYLLQELELGWEWLPPAPDGSVSFEYPAGDGQIVEVGFDVPEGDWRVQDTYEQALARFVSEDLEEIEYRLVSDAQEDLNALIDDFEMWFPAADIQREEVEVAGATQAMVAVTDATGTEDPFSQSALMVTSDAGYTFQFSYLSGAGSYDPDTAEEVLSTFGLSIRG